MEHKLTDPIATRVLRKAGQRKVTVTVGKPRRAGQKEWACAFQIKGIGDSQVRAAFGLDAFQALLQAMEGVRVAVAQSGESYTWAGGEEGDPGFPRFVPGYFGISFADRVNRLIDKEVEDFSRAKEAAHKAGHDR